MHSIHTNKQKCEFPPISVGCCFDICNDYLGSNNLQCAVVSPVLLFAPYVLRSIVKILKVDRNMKFSRYWSRSYNFKETFK